MGWDVWIFGGERLFSLEAFTLLKEVTVNLPESWFYGRDRPSTLRSSAIKVADLGGRWIGRTDDLWIARARLASPSPFSLSLVSPINNIIVIVVSNNTIYRGSTLWCLSLLHFHPLVIIVHNLVEKNDGQGR